MFFFFISLQNYLWSSNCELKILLIIAATATNARYKASDKRHQCGYGNHPKNYDIILVQRIEHVPGVLSHLECFPETNNKQTNKSINKFEKEKHKKNNNSFVKIKVNIFYFKNFNEIKINLK